MHLTAPLTPLEAKALFLFADAGMYAPTPAIARDTELTDAAVSGILKLQAVSQLGLTVPLRPERT